MADILTLSHDLSSVVLHSDEPDQRVGHLSNSALSNKCFYANSFRHLQVDVLAEKVWRNAAPLKCKIFCWMAKRQRLPTNERRFRHSLANSATCPSCDQDEDTNHLLLGCSRAREVWMMFFLHLCPFPASLEELWSLRGRSYEDSTIITVVA
jgi:hypothetical protein